MSDPEAIQADPDPRRLRIAGRDPALTGEVLERAPVRPLRAPAIPAATLMQILCGLLALAGLFLVAAEIVSTLMAVGITALVAGCLGVLLAALREAKRI